MAKLQLLNAYLTERLMVAVDEILEVVGGTVSELEEETARTRRENDLLKRRLRDVGLDTGTDWTGTTSRPTSLSVSAAASPAGQHQWSSNHGKDTEPTLTQQNPAVTVDTSNQGPTICTQWEGPYQSPTSVSPQINSSETIPALTSQCVKEDQDPSPLADPFSRCTEDRGVMHCGLDGIKEEPHDTSTEYGSIPAETGYGEFKSSPDPDTAIAETRYNISNPNTHQGSVTVETRYAALHLPTDLASTSNSIQDGIERPIGTDGLITGPEQDFATASLGPLVSLVKPRSTSSNKGQRLTNSKCQRLHPCSHCGKTFSHVSRLKIHLRIHTGEKPYVCALCGKRFNNDGTLRNHQRVHTELRLYSCPLCGMSFKDAYTCRKHQRVHNEMRPHECSLCGKAFAEAGKLDKHFRTHTSYNELDV